MVELMHLKLTGSLYRALEKAKRSNQRIVFTAKEDCQALRIYGGSKEIVFNLQTEDTDSNHVIVASVDNNKNSKTTSYIGALSARLRTLADIDSFNHVKEELLKDVEQTRQQKINAHKFQAECVSSLKKQRSEKIANAGRNKRSSALLQLGSEPDKTAPMTKSKAVERKRTPDTVRIRPAPCTNQSTRSTLSGPITVPKHSRSTNPDVINSDSVEIAQIPLFRRLALAADRRKVLEDRLSVALTEEDKGLREQLISETRADLIALVEELRRDDDLVRLFVPVPQ